MQTSVPTNAGCCSISWPRCCDTNRRLCVNDKVRKHSLRSLILVAAPVCLVLSLTSGCVYAQSAPLGLNEVYQKARLQDPQYKAAQNAFAAGLEKLPQARAALLPSANLNASKGRQFGGASFSEAAYIERDVQNTAWTVQITQPLFRWNHWVGLRQANAQVRVSLVQFAQAEQDLLLRCAQAYSDAVLSLQSQELAKSQVHAIGEQLTLAERTYAVGTGTMTDVQEARAKLALTQAQKVAADNEVEVKGAELEKLLGETVVLPAGDLSSLVQQAFSMPVQDVQQLSHWMSTVHKNLQIQLQEAALEVARQETAKIQAGHMPTLDLMLGRNGSYNSGSLSSPADLSVNTVSNSVSVQLTVPLYSGGATQSRIRESIALEEKALEDLALAQRNATAQVRQAYAGVINGQAQVAALEVAVLAGRNAVESNKIGLKIGTRITPDVLNAEQQLFASLRDLYKARIDRVMQSLKLKAAVGQLQPEDLQIADAVLASALQR
ncbi:MAG: type I secretion protein TolC [Betaproteobacteria bacterium]|nr:type I secretion protein TolC [Betaproteobacteria bacterium]